MATVALGILFAGTEPAIAQNSVSICSRTQQVQTAILAELPDVSDCALVTSTNLAGITMLNLGSQSMTALQAGDFDGLSSLHELDLVGINLTTLPDGVFDDLSSLQVLNLDGNLQQRLCSWSIFCAKMALLDGHTQRERQRSHSVLAWSPRLVALVSYRRLACWSQRLRNIFIWNASIMLV